MGNFGISGIWKRPGTTIPGLLAAGLGVFVALGYIQQDTVPMVVSIAAPIIIGIVGVLYKGCPPCAPGGPENG